MASWQIAGCLFALFVSLPAQAEQKYELKEKVAAGDQCLVEMDMSLAGELSVKSGEKSVALKLSASASHKFPERVLSVGTDGLPTRVARSYDQAKADITVHGQTSTRSLRADRKFQVAQRIKEETITYSPVGPLTREELELTGEHVDILALPGLLPDQAMTVGQTWKVRPSVAQILGGLDGLTHHDLTCKLEEVKGDQARISISGVLEGIADGAEIKMTAEGHYIFDLQVKRLVSLTWKTKDQREHGPVSPAAKTESTTTVKRTFGIPSDTLLEGLVKTVPQEPNAGHLLLSFRDAQGRWEFLYDRAWQVVSQTDQYSVLRLLNRGELVAQLNITPWPKARPGEHLSADELRKHVDKSPDFKLEQVLQSDKIPDDEGRWVYRLSIVAVTGELKLLQNYYAIASPQGDQVILTFTTEVPQAERLGERDLEIVGSLTFPESKPRKTK